MDSFKKQNAVDERYGESMVSKEKLLLRVCPHIFPSVYSLSSSTIESRSALESSTLMPIF